MPRSGILNELQRVTVQLRNECWIGANQSSEIEESWMCLGVPGVGTGERESATR